VDPTERPRRRLRHLRRDRALNSQQHRLYRRPLAHSEQEPQPDVEVDEVDGYEDVRRRYAAWGCSAPSPQERKDNAFD
jgi:hypothetical protein